MSDIEKIIFATSNKVSGYTDKFHPFKWSDPSEKDSRRKAFAEGMIYLYVSKKIGGSPTGEMVSSLRSAVKEQRYKELLQRYPSKIRLYGAPGACASALGWTDERTDELLREYFDHPAVINKERVPMRELDLVQLRHMSGLGPHLDVDQLLQRTLINNPPHLIYCNIHDAYVLTHDLLYCCDLGVEPRLVDDDTSYGLAQTIDGLILRFAAEGHTDIVAELVTVGMLVDEISPPTVEFVVEWFSNLVEEHGHVPGPMSKDGVFLTQSGRVTNNSSDTGQAEWKRHYHTNIVANLAGRTIAESGRPHSRDVPRNLLEKIGTVLASLADYRIKDGASVLNEIQTEEVSPYYEGIVDACISFIQNQKRRDGMYGYWPDERNKFQEVAGPDASFETAMMEDVSRACKSVLEENK